MSRRVPLALLLLLVACGKASESPGDPPGDPPGGGDNPSHAIQGSLVVHMPIRPPDLLSAYALLGDGSRFRQPLDAQGNARFEDPAIVGPQDVSIVMVKNPPSSAVTVYTVLGIDQPELWLSHPFGSSPSLSKQATLSGRVTGASGTGTVSVRVVGDNFSGSQSVAPDGTFSIEVMGAAAGQISLYAQELASDGFTVLRTGLKRGIAVGGGQPVTGQDVALDHPVDQFLEATVEGGSAYSSQAHMYLSFYEGNSELFRTEAFGPHPLRVPTVARTPPFDATRVMLTVRLGDRERFPSGSARAERPVASTATSVGVQLLAPMRFDAPAVGTKRAPTSVPRSNLVVRWSADPTAQMSRLGIGSVGGQSSPLSWIIWAPPSITSFTPFALPAEVSPTSTFPQGLHAMEVDAFFHGDVRGYADYFGSSQLKEGVTERRETRLLGYVNLQ